MLTAAHHEPGKSRRTDIRLLRPCAPALREKAAGTDFAHWSTGVNPIGRWAEKHFEEPSVTVVLPFGYAVLVHEPRAIRRVLLENTVNYPKGFAATPGFLSAGLNDRLLSAEGARWQVQRRALAPMFTPRTTMSFAPYLPVGFVQVNAMRLTLRLSALRRRTANVQRLGLALQEAVLVLATIVKKFRLDLASGCAVWPLLRVTLRPAHGLRMIASPR